MTMQEQQMIDDLVQRIRSTQLSEKDPDAEQHLQQGLAGYPDAIYVLAQTILVQKYGLEQAQQQIQALQQQIDTQQQALEDEARQPKKPGSFLGNLLGMNEPSAPTTPYQPQAPYQPAGGGGTYPPGYGAPPSYGAPLNYGAPTGYGAPAGYGAPGGGGFLRSALQTAAGVAAGEMMFQGMESLFHGFGGGSNFGGGFGEGHPSEVINNNYYGDENAPEHHNERGQDTSFYNPANDASRDSDSDRSQFAGGGDDAASSTDDGSDAQAFDDPGLNNGNDDNYSDDSEYGNDNSGSDDSGSDDGGSF